MSVDANGYPWRDAPPMTPELVERDLWSDEICALVDAAFETVSRNPSDHETAVAYRRAIAAALEASGIVQVREALKFIATGEPGQAACVREARQALASLEGAG